jgi:hypothetical protein
MTELLGRAIRQFPHLIEGTVDELSLEVLVQHDEARFDLIQY